MLHTCISSLDHGSMSNLNDSLKFWDCNLKFQLHYPPESTGFIQPWVPLLLIFSASTCLTQRLSFFVISVVDDFADSPISWENSPLLRAQSKISKYLKIHFRHVSSVNMTCENTSKAPNQTGETFPVSDWLPMVEVVAFGQSSLSYLLGCVIQITLRSRIRRDVMMSLQFDNVWYCISPPYTSKFSNIKVQKFWMFMNFPCHCTYPSPIQEPTRPVLWKCPWR